MALTEDEKRKAMQQLRDQDKQRQEKEAEANKDAKPVDVIKQESKDDKDAIIEALKSQIAKKDETIGSLKSQADDQFSEKTFLQENEALNAVLKGNDGKNFVKEYNLDVENSDNKLHFIVKMHLPNVMEISAIEQEFVDLTKGRGNSFSQTNQMLFRAISYFRVVGDEVPEWFKDPESTYRWDIILSTWLDYEEWEDSFRDQQFK